MSQETGEDKQKCGRASKVSHKYGTTFTWSGETEGK